MPSLHELEQDSGPHATVLPRGWHLQDQILWILSSLRDIDWIERSWIEFDWSWIDQLSHPHPKYVYNSIFNFVVQNEWFIVLAEAAADAALVTVTPPEEEPKVPPRGQRYNPFNRVTEGEREKSVPGSRHRKFWTSKYLDCIGWPLQSVQMSIDLIVIVSFEYT